MVDIIKNSTPPSFLINALNELAADADVKSVRAPKNRARYAAQIADVFRRLVYDKRMAGIYAELLKHARPERHQFYDAKPLWMNTKLQYDATPHEKAIIGLLLTAAHLVVDPPFIFAKRVLENGPIPELAELREYEAQHGSAIVLTKAGAQNAALTAFLRKITNETRAVFSSPLYLTVATIANIALNRDDITESTVRGAIKDC